MVGACLKNRIAFRRNRSVEPSGRIWKITVEPSSTVEGDVPSGALRCAAGSATAEVPENIGKLPIPT